MRTLLQNPVEDGARRGGHRDMEGALSGLPRERGALTQVHDKRNVEWYWRFRGGLKYWTSKQGVSNGPHMRRRMIIWRRSHHFKLDIEFLRFLYRSHAEKTLECESPCDHASSLAKAPKRMVGTISCDWLGQGNTTDELDSMAMQRPSQFLDGNPLSLGTSS
mmetsp:Transcript_1207/g.2538  ORF Transcript_1207/g.2538 Transcript_1207/m.2538 type:complete len:162 (-) Transcript_1207:910-1395(-)